MTASAALTLTQPNTLTTLPPPSSLAEIQTYAQLFADSNMFLDAKQMAQAAVRILAGAELGIRPFASMSGINIIKGKTTLAANLMATIIKRSNRYNYRITEHSETVCKIAFTENGSPCGESEFTWQNAVKAKLSNNDNWQNYPKNMLFARAMSNGARWFCPDVFGGPVYTPEEMGATVDGDGEIIEVQFSPAPAPAPPEPTEEEKAAQTESRRFWSIAAKFGILPTALNDDQCIAWLTTLLAHPIPAEFTAATWKTLGSGMRAYGRMAAADVAMLEPAFILAYVQRTWKEVGSLLQMSNGMWQGVIGMIEEETAEKAHLKECAAPLELLEAPTPVELQTPGAFK